MTKYTYTFEREDEAKFREVLSRLDPVEYVIIQDIKLLDETDPRYSKREAIIEMDPEACLTFRLGMKQVKIRRERTEEELAEEKALHEKNTIRVNVKVDGLIGPGSTTP